MQSRTDKLTGTKPANRVSGLMRLKRTGRGLLLALLLLLLVGCMAPAAAPSIEQQRRTRREKAGGCEFVLVEFTVKLKPP